MTAHALTNSVEGIKTLVFVSAKANGVKIDNMWEILNDKMKSFPIEKVLRGLSKVADTYVIANLNLTKVADAENV